MLYAIRLRGAGGDERVRTDDPLLAKQVLSQLSYTPMSFPSAALLFLARSALLVGSSGLEPPTSRLSGVRSNHLSYEPSSPPAPGTLKIKQRVSGPLTLEVLRFLSSLLRKEVIQPHLPIRLPCYDFTPIANPTFGSVFGYYRLSWCDGRCVQGPGTYSPRHADPRLLAIPSSYRRVAACNLNWDCF